MKNWQSNLVGVLWKHEALKEISYKNEKQEIVEDVVLNFSISQPNGEHGMYLKCFAYGHTARFVANHLKNTAIIQISGQMWNQVTPYFCKKDQRTKKTRIVKFKTHTVNLIHKSGWKDSDEKGIIEKDNIEKFEKDAKDTWDSVKSEGNKDE